MKILNGFFKSFGSGFSLSFLDSVLMFSLLCLRVGIHFAVCGNLSASETPGHWKLGLNCFRKLETERFWILSDCGHFAFLREGSDQTTLV